MDPAEQVPNQERPSDDQAPRFLEALALSEQARSGWLHLSEDLIIAYQHSGPQPQEGQHTAYHSTSATPGAGETHER